MREKRRVENRHALDFNECVVVVNILIFCVVFYLSRLNLPKRVFAAADVAGRVDDVFHNLVVVGHFAEFAGRDAGFVFHDDADVGHVAFGHFVVKFDIVGKNDGSVGLNDADVADGRDNIVFLVVNDLVGLQRLVLTDNIDVADSGNGLHVFVVDHFVGTEINIVGFFFNSGGRLRFGVHERGNVVARFQFGIGFGLIRLPAERIRFKRGGGDSRSGPKSRCRPKDFFAENFIHPYFP